MSKRRDARVEEVHISVLTEDALHCIMSWLNALDYWWLANVSKHWASLFSDRKNVCLIVNRRCKQCGAKTLGHHCSLALGGPCETDETIRKAVQWHDDIGWYHTERLLARLFYSTHFGGFCILFPQYIWPSWLSSRRVVSRLYRLHKHSLQYQLCGVWQKADGMKFIDIVRIS